MNGTAVLREHDPKYLKRRRWERRGVIIVAFLAVVAVGAAGFAVASALKVEKRITKVEQSACADAQADPTDVKASRECQKVRAAAERTANENVNCIPFRLAGYICPKPGSPLAEEHRARQIREAVGPHGGVHGPTASVAPTSSGGDASQSPVHHTGSSQAGHQGGGGGSSKVGGGGGGVKKSPEKLPPPAGGGGSNGGGAPAPGSPAPTSPTAPSPSQPPSSPAPERTPEEPPVVAPAPEPEAPVTTGLGSVVESVGTTVEGIGETVGGTVEETGHTVNEVVGGLGCQLTHTC